MTGTLDTFTNIEWKWLGLWIGIITFSAKRRESRYFNWPLVDIDRDSGYLLILSGNNWDSGYYHWPLVATKNFEY